jgi:hypothetical protein
MKQRLALISSVWVAIMLLLITAGLTLAQGAGAGADRQGPFVPDATAPGAIPIQGRLTTASGAPLNGTYTMTFRLYDVVTATVAMCADVRYVVVANGLFSDYIDGCYSDITGQKLWLGIQVGSDPEMTPRQVIYPVPYALSLVPKAEISGTVGSNDAILDIDNTGVNGKGLRAEAQAATGVNYGVVGAAKSLDGFGGYFYNNGGGIGLSGWSIGSNYNPAIFGCVDASSANCDPISNSAGVQGVSSLGDGVQGVTNNSTYRGVYAGNNGNGIALAANNVASDTVNHTKPTVYLIQGSAEGDFVVGVGSYLGTRYWRVDRTGKGFFNGGTQASGADFAEQIAVRGDEKNYEPGDVLVISTQADRAVELSTRPFATTVIGVYSTQPALLAGAPDQNDPLNGIPVAITGIVPCKVSAENGAIQRGDLLVTSSKPGYAMRAGTNPPQGTVLGKALGGLKDGNGVIQVLVTLQ